MKNIIIAIGMFACLPFYLSAQSDEDALRYSQLTVGGTARFVGFGGAFGALGADFSSLSFNPAGLGLFRSSELSFSPSITATGIQTNFQGEINQINKDRFNLSNFGIVIASDLTKRNTDNKWKRLNMGFGANRTNDFNKTTFYRGFNSQNSLVDYYLEQLNSSGISPSQVTNTFPFSSALVWESYLVNPNTVDTNSYVSVIPNGQVEQDRRIEESGSVTEYVFSVASNYDDHLFLGATLGMPSLHYSYASSYVESDLNGDIADFSNFQLLDNLSTDGMGINGKFGFAYRVNDWVRFGGAIHTPTYYSLHDSYNSFITAIFDTSEGHTYTTPDGSYNYGLITPWRAIGSVAFFFKTYGFISVDYEFVDYSAMQYNFKKTASQDDIIFENTLNQTIDQKYGTASNLRIGGEFVYDIFRFRAGFDYYGSPFKAGIAEDGFDQNKKNISGGFGIKTDNFSIDAAYMHSLSKEFYQPYTLSTEAVPGVGIEKNTGNVVLTLGYKF